MLTAVWNPEGIYGREVPVGCGVFEIPSISIETFNAGVTSNLEAFDKDPNSSRSLSEAA
jgi:hypothetical protein